MKVHIVGLFFRLALASAGGALYFAANRAQVDDLGLDWSQPKHPVTEEMWTDAAKLEGAIAPNLKLESILGEDVVVGKSDRPQFVYFIKNDCPCSVDAQPLYARLQKRFGDKATFVGISDAFVEEAERWRRQMDMQYPLVSNPKTDIMEAFKAPRSVYAALIGKSGKIVKLWPGYSAEMLQEVNALLAKELEVEEEEFDPQYAPIDALSGCMFEPRS